MTEAEKNHRQYLNRLTKGVSHVKSGPRLTLDPTKAAIVVDSIDGKRFPRGYVVTKRMEKYFTH